MPVPFCFFGPVANAGYTWAKSQGAGPEYNSLSDGVWGAPGHNMMEPAIEYQDRIVRTFGDPPPNPGEELWMGRWLDGVKFSTNKILEAKGPGWEHIFNDLVDKLGFTKPYEDLVDGIEARAEIARRIGGTVEVHAAEQGFAERLRRIVRQIGADDVVDVKHTQ